MKQLAILGSTGSIGVSTLKVVDSLADRFGVVALAAGTNLDLLEQQIRRFRPTMVAVRDAEIAAALSARVSHPLEITHGAEGLVGVATHADADLVVSALVGAIGLMPTYAALQTGRDVALANKEALVVAGEHMTRCAEQSGARILPVDSEHNALHQCLRGESLEEVRRLWLTASGGPFRKHSREQLASVTREEALNHPTWKMGPKITIDSATLMNKGLEVIEASWLFGVGPDRIRVVVHPTSVVHSLIELVDGSFKAQLGVTDMRHAIQYALSWPERWNSDLPPFDPVRAGPLEFDAPDLERFPCLALAYRALRAGGAAPAVLNAANEVAVQSFLAGEIAFVGIPRLIERALESHASATVRDVGDLLRLDAAARKTALRLVEQGIRP